MSIWKQLKDLDVQGQHNLCFYPKTGRTDIEPLRKNRTKKCLIESNKLELQPNIKNNIKITSPA